MNINDLMEIKKECLFCKQTVTKICQNCNWYISVPNTNYSVMFNIVNNNVVWEELSPEIYNPKDYSFNLAIDLSSTKIQIWIDKIIHENKICQYNPIINAQLPESIFSSKEIKMFAAKLMKNYLYA